MKNLLIAVLLFTIFCKEQVRAEVVVEETKYVTATSGLIYRNKPKGNRLGVFGFASKLIVVERTNIFQEIKSEGKRIKGEWVAVKLYNNKVYVFDGFLSSLKPTFKELIFSDVKDYLYEGVWVPSEFLINLKRTKSFEKSLRTLGPHNILFYDNNQVNIISEGEMEETYLEINDQCEIVYPNYKDVIPFKILRINRNNMLIEDKDGMVVNYFKVYRPMGNDQSYSVVREGVKQVTQNWFSGNYKFVTDDYIDTISFSREYESLRMFYTDEESFEVIRIGGRFYRVVDIKGNSYYLKHIVNARSEDEPLKYNSKIDILTKI